MDTKKNYPEMNSIRISKTWTENESLTARRWKMATEMTVQNGESSLGGENEATTSPNADRSDETFNNSTEELVQVYLTTAALGCVTKKK